MEAIYDPRLRSSQSSPGRAPAVLPAVTSGTPLLASSLCGCLGVYEQLMQDSSYTGCLFPRPRTQRGAHRYFMDYSIPLHIAN
jgi:hypothetical protein